MNTNITNIIGHEIKDSRGNPTVEVFVYVDDVFSSFKVPSGASTGSFEAYEMRDEATNGMSKVISIIELVVRPKLIGIDVTNQKEIDSILLLLDGTEHKTVIGGNTMIGISIACTKCAAKVQNKNTYEYLRTLATKKITTNETPYLYVNLINGGKHAHSALAFQEYHVIPQTKDVKEALDIVNKIIDELEKVLTTKGFGLEKGDEGGYAIKTDNVILPLEILEEVVNNLSLQGNVRFALDVAASSFYDEKSQTYKIGEETGTKEELFEIYKTICSKYDLISIEDPFYEEGFDSFANFGDKLGTTFFVGDDLTTTNLNRIEKAKNQNSIGGVIIKPNQIGTLSETIEAIEYAHNNGIKCIVSHRSGETMDDFISDLVVAFNCYGIKAGSPRAIERKVKYDRLVEIFSSNTTKPTEKSAQEQSKTIIIATIGPASGEKETLKNMIMNGMDMARLNMSWGTYEKHTEYINNIRDAVKEAEKDVAIIMDLSGPRVKEEVGHHVDSNSLEVITEKDKKDAEFGSKMKVDYFAMSYVKSAQDILDLKVILKSYGSDAKIISKIERKEAVANFEEIAKASDIVMIARGDLANEYPLGEIPFVEKELLSKAKALHVPIIVATEMLLSTTYKETPSRAEVTDEVFAIINGADAVMLSEETANGKFPIESVKSMEEIASRTENYHSNNYEKN